MTLFSEPAQQTVRSGQQAADGGEQADGEAAATQFAHGPIPPVGPMPTGTPGPSASEQAFGDGPSGYVGAGGAGLPDDVRGKFEQSLGADLSGVRVHQDERAGQVGAKAVTMGQNIHFARGQYDPASRGGQELLAHEVAHTVQQKDATPQAQHKDVAPSSAPAERDADRAASAMVAGERTNVMSVAQQQPHAKEAEWMGPIRASLKSGDWDDVALRLNGLGLDDMKAVIRDVLTPGQRAHVRGAAQHVMAGWPEHVTETIDQVAGDKGDGDIKGISAHYTAYEKALASARGGGAWKPVADQLVAMGAWDQHDRLTKLTWEEMQALRSASDNAGLLAAIDKADAARAKAVLDAYDREVKSGQWRSACNHLNAMSDEDIYAKLKPLEYTQLTSLLQFASNRVRQLVEGELSWRHKPDKETDPTQPEQVDELVDVEPPLVPLPDFSSDHRTSVEARDAGGDWSGSAELEGFANNLAMRWGEAIAKKKNGKVDQLREMSSVLNKLRNQWRRAIHDLGVTNTFSQFATVARYWAADASQLRLFELHKGELGAFHLDTSAANVIDRKKDQAGLDALLEKFVGAGPNVRPITNEFCKKYQGTPRPSYFLNYPGHGSWGLEGQGYSVDLMFDGLGTAGRNEEGFVPREAALQVIYNIAATAESVGGDWQVVYNDFSVARAASKKYPGRVTSAGINDKDDDPTSKQNNNGHGTHGPINLHFHVDIVPKANKESTVKDPAGAAPKKEQ